MRIRHQLGRIRGFVSRILFVRVIMKEAKRLKKWLKNRNKIIDDYRKQKSIKIAKDQNWRMAHSKKELEVIFKRESL